MKRIMGLDLGTKTIGVALSDALQITAQPHQTLRRQNLKLDIATLQKWALEFEVGELVAGLPLNMDGSEGGRAVATRKLGDAIALALSYPLHYVDERLTTVAAERMLIEANASRDKRKAVIDTVAATLILQAFLDRRSTGAENADP
jgi:putative holliday junction resolvase